MRERERERERERVVMKEEENQAISVILEKIILANIPIYLRVQTDEELVDGT